MTLHKVNIFKNNILLQTKLNVRYIRKINRMEEKIVKVLEQYLEENIYGKQSTIHKVYFDSIAKEIVKLLTIPDISTNSSFDNEKWHWKMDYCKRKQIPPAQSWVWDEAEVEYNRYKEDRYKEIKTEENYNKLLTSGMFWEFHPELTGNWEVDKIVILADVNTI